MPRAALAAEPAGDSPPSLDQIWSAPGHLVRRVHQISSALFAEECGRFDLTPVQYAALVAIGANPLLDATRLSALIAFDRSTLGDVLERLEAKGWIVRIASAADKRVKLLSLSADGARQVRLVRPAVDRVQERLLAPLSATDRCVLTGLLTRLADLHNDVLPAPLLRPATT